MTTESPAPPTDTLLDESRVRPAAYPWLADLDEAMPRGDLRAVLRMAEWGQRAAALQGNYPSPRLREEYEASASRLRAAIGGEAR